MLKKCIAHLTQNPAGVISFLTVLGLGSYHMLNERYRWGAPIPLWVWWMVAQLISLSYLLSGRK